MRKYAVAALMCFLVSSLAFTQTANKRMYVNIKEVQIKSGTGFFSKKIASANYGDAVYILQEKGKWVKISLVSSTSISGWVPASNLTKKKITNSYDDKTSANAKELALAGKGLTEGTGKEFKSSGKNYPAVEKVEAIAVSMNELQQFIQSGNLKDGE